MRALAGLAMALHIMPAAAQTPVPYSPRTTPMTFRLLSGEGPAGAQQWIEATGQIRTDTPKEFEAFRRQHKLDGLTMVLDSNGGSVIGAMIVGRAMRSLGIRTTVGRTVETDRGQALRSRDVQCASACVLLLTAGKERNVPGDASIGLHMFGLSVNAEGHRARDEISLRDVEEAQRTMAAHAVYLHEMNVHPRLLTLMTEASFRGPLKIMTQAEIRETQLASIVDPLTPPLELARSWSLSPPAATPQLVRAQRLVAEPERTVTQELVLECDGVRGFYWTTYRMQVTGPDKAKAQATLQLARVETGGWDYIFRPPGRGLSAKPDAPAWMRRSIPQKVFADAIANRKLALEVVDGARGKRVQDFYDAGFEKMFAELGKRCEARPNRVTMGGNPRR